MSSFSGKLTSSGWSAVSGGRCLVGGLVAEDGSRWDDDCNTCQCHDGRITCSLVRQARPSCLLFFFRVTFNQSGSAPFSSTADLRPAASMGTRSPLHVRQVTCASPSQTHAASPSPALAKGSAGAPPIRPRPQPGVSQMAAALTSPSPSTKTRWHR